MSVINILMYWATWKPRGVNQNEKGKVENLNYSRRKKLLTIHSSSPSEPGSHSPKKCRNGEDREVR